MTRCYNILGQTEGGASVKFDRYPYLKHSPADPQEATAREKVATEKTLADYIAHKTKPKKLTFDEWFLLHGQYNIDLPQVNRIKELMKLSWEVARENK